MYPKKGQTEDKGLITSIAYRLAAVALPPITDLPCCGINLSKGTELCLFFSGPAHLMTCGKVFKEQEEMWKNTVVTSPNLTPNLGKIAVIGIRKSRQKSKIFRVLLV